MIDTQAIRSKILDLAMRGKLTEQLPEDGTAEELYRQIQKEKQALIKAGKIKKEKPLPDILEDDLPFEIPQNWRWARLADITSNLTLNDGDWVLSDDMDENGSVKLIQLGSIGDRQYRDKGFKHLTTQRFETLNAKQIYPGYLLINRLVADKMLLCILPEIEGVLITAVDVCWVAPQNKYYDIKFLMYALASSGMQQKVKEVGYGVTRFRISKTNLISVPFPFPPLAEQHRIVARIEQAFSTLDTIDALQAKYADNLTVLKRKLIDAAIQGKLTEQLPEDGTADELYRQIQAEKQALIKAGKIKKEKPLPEITADEIPFEIPANWKWVRFADLYSISNGVASRGTPGGKPHPVLRLANLVSGKINSHSIREIALSDEEFSTHKVLNGDLVFIRVNGSRDKVADAFLYSGETAISYCDHLFCGHRTSDSFDASYIMTVYHSAMAKAQIDPEIKTTAGQNTINQKSMGKILIPLPPLAEQKRIVHKLEELLPLCEKVEVIAKGD